MIIFGGVDGTGVWNNREYDRQMEFSFVRTLYNSWAYGPRNYERGPHATDWRVDRATRWSADKTYRHVLRYWKSSKTDKAVFLAGYSRGGAAVIEVAKWLKTDKIPVECLILYDPVDRTGQVGLPWQNTPITNNVHGVIYAIRDPAAGSRGSFGNCGLWMENGERTPVNPFFATHAGLGGVPWPIPEGKKGTDLVNEGIPDFLTNVTYDQDRLGAMAVQACTFNLIADVLSECRERMRKKPYVPNPPQNYLPPVRPTPGNGQRIHIVKPGDWLSKLAITYYGDMNKWEVIYKANLDKIKDPNLIEIGQKLIIP